jgi:hypothetical protein
MSKTVLFGGAGAYPTAANPTLLASGEIAVYSIAADGTYSRIASGSTFTSAQKQLPAMIAQGGVTGGNFKSVMLYPGSLFSVPSAATSYVAPVPNVDIVGYSGNANDGNTISSGVAGTYSLTVTNTSKTAPPLPFNMASAYYSTNVSATAIAIALDWTKSINSKTLNTSLQPYDRFVMAQVLLAADSTVTTPGTETVTVTNGSTTVVTSAALTGFSAGGYIRLGAAATSGNRLAPVYKIASVDSTTRLTLTTPFVDPSLALNASQIFNGTSTIATSAVTYITAANGAVAGAGVRLTSFGNWFAGSAFKELYPNYSIAAGVSGLAVGTPIIHNGVVAQSYSTGATITSGIAKVGYGVGWQAQKQEYEAQGYQGNTNRSWLPYPVQYFASATTNYDGYAFNYRSYPTSGGANDGNYKSEIHECVIFCTTPATDSGDILASAGIPAILASYI